MPVKKARLWSPEDPHLYDLVVSSKLGNRAIDKVEGYFGMRKISLGKDEKGFTRLMLNNKPYFQFGPLDQGFWPDGLYTAPTDAALRYDIEMTKKLGFNSGAQAREGGARPVVLLVRQTGAAGLAGHAQR